MNIDAIVLNQILTNRIQRYLLKGMYMYTITNCGLIHVGKPDLVFENQCNPPY